MMEDYELAPEEDIEKVYMAISWYGDWWFEALLECDTTHILGDCPICGAT